MKNGAVLVAPFFYRIDRTALDLELNARKLVAAVGKYLRWQK
jgi:hypothetical protein